MLGHIIPRNVTKVQQGPGIFTGCYKQDQVSLIWGTADRGTTEPVEPAEPAEPVEPVEPAEPAEPTEPKEMTVLLQLPLVNVIK